MLADVDFRQHRTRRFRARCGFLFGRAPVRRWLLRDGSDRRLWQRLAPSSNYLRARPAGARRMGATLAETAIALPNSAGRSPLIPFCGHGVCDRSDSADGRRRAAPTAGLLNTGARIGTTPSAATTSRHCHRPPFGDDRVCITGEYLVLHGHVADSVRGARDGRRVDRSARRGRRRPRGDRHRCPRLTSPVRSSRSGWGPPAADRRDARRYGAVLDAARALRWVAEMLGGAEACLDRRCNTPGGERNSIDRGSSRRSGTPAPT